MSSVGFGWKRKACELKGAPAPPEKAFKPEEQSEEVEDPDFDWVALTKKKKVDALEDGKARFERLKVEGSCLAEEGRFWEALGRWQEALELQPNNARVWEMRAQALVALHEWDGAVEAAEKATSFENTWSVHHSIGLVWAILNQVGRLPNVGQGLSWPRSPGGCTHLFSEGGAP